MSTNKSYQEENSYSVKRQFIGDIIKKLNFNKEKIEKRMEELQPDDSPKENDIYDLEEK
jgi:hypothetical protein